MMTKKVRFERFWGKNGVYPTGKILAAPMFHMNDRYSTNVIEVESELNGADRYSTNVTEVV